MKKTLKLVIQIFLLLVLTSLSVSAMPEPIPIDNSELIITKYDGVEAETYLPTTEGNQLCLYHKANTNATSLEELRELIEQAQEQVPNWTIGVSYEIDDLVSYNDLIYKVLQAHTSQADWTPDVVPALFVEYAFQELGEVPQWVQPTGSHDAYNIDDRVWFEVNEEKLIYESTIDANVWSPTAYPAGWNEIGKIKEIETYGNESITAINELGNSIVVPRNLEDSLSTYCINVTKTIQIGENTIIAELINDTDYVYPTSTFEYRNITARFFCNDEAIEYPAASIIAEDLIDIGVKWVIQVPENYTCDGKFTMRTNVLEIEECEGGQMGYTNCQISKINVDDFENSSENVFDTYTDEFEIENINKSITEYYPSWLECLSWNPISIYNCMQTPLYDTNWYGAFTDFDPSYDIVYTSSSDVLEQFMNKTRVNSLGISLDNPVLFMDFDSAPVGITVDDLSPYENDGALNSSGNPAYDSSCGSSPGGGCYTFDGSDDYIKINKSSTLDMVNEMSVSFWINASTPGSITFPFSQNDMGDGDRKFLVELDTAGLLRVFISDDGTYNNGHYKEYRTATTVGDSTWHHFAATFDDGELILYVDGEPEQVNRAKDDAITTLHDASLDILFGARENSDVPVDFFDGQLDHMQVFDKGLTRDEVKDLYNNPPADIDNYKKGDFKSYIYVGTFNDSSWETKINYNCLNTTNQSVTCTSNRNITSETRTAISYNLSDADLIGLWSMNGDGDDELGVYNGTEYGDTSYSEDYGVVGQGAHFDGSGDSLWVGDDILDLGQPFSISAWVNIEDITHNSYTIMSATVQDVGDDYFLFMHRADKDGLTVQWDNSGATTAFWCDEVSRDLTPNKWTHAVMVYHGPNNPLQIYQDGDLIVNDTSFPSSAQDPGTYHWTIGAFKKTSPNNNWNGELDEIRLYNRTLSQAEVTSLYELGSYHIEWGDWQDEGVMINNTFLQSTGNGIFFQHRYNLNSNDSSVIPFVLNNTIEEVLFTNVAPTNPSPTLISVDGTNRSIIDLNCTDTIEDGNEESMNVTWRFYKDDVLNLTIQDNSNYADGSTISQVLDAGNLSVGEEWKCSLELTDGSLNSSEVNSSVLTVKSSSQLLIELSNPTTDTNVTQNRFFEFTVNVTCLVEDCGDINVSLDPYDNKDPDSASCSQADEIFQAYPADSSVINNGYNSNYGGWCTNSYGAVCENNGDTSPHIYLILGDSDCDTYLGAGTGSCGAFLSNDWGDEYICPSYERKGSQVAAGDCAEFDCSGLIDSGMEADMFDFTDEFFSSAPIARKSGLIPEGSGEPFYTNGTNPTTINLNTSQSQLVTWYVNATGIINLTSTFFAYANLTNYMYVSNTTEEINITIVELTADTTPPTFTYIPPNESITYGDNWTGVDFNATDETGISEYFINYTTLFNISQEGVLINTSVIPTSTYEINVSVNDTSNNVNSSIFKVTVDKEYGEVNLYLDGARASETVEVHTPVSIDAYLINGTNALFNLTIDGEEVNSSTTSTYLNYTFDDTGLGDHIVNLTYAGNQNYTSAYETWTITYEDTSAPTVVVVYPDAGQTYGDLTLYLNYTIDDNNPSYCWYSKDNGATNSSAVTAGTNFTVTGVEGSNTWKVYCNDTSENLGSDAHTFDIDISAPTWTVIPDNKTDQTALRQNIDSLSETFTATDTTAISQYFLANETDDFNISQDGLLINITALTANHYYINVSVNDTLDNVNSTIYLVEVETAPIVTIVQPQATSYTYQKTNINVTIQNDTLLYNCWYSTDNYVTNNSQACEQNVTGITSTEGSNTWAFCANNTNSFEHCDTVTFTINLPLKIWKVVLKKLSWGANRLPDLYCIYLHNATMCLDDNGWRKEG